MKTLSHRDAARTHNLDPRGAIRLSCDQGVASERQKLPQELAGVRFSFEPSDIVSRVMSFGAPTPIEVAVSGPNLHVLSPLHAGILDLSVSTLADQVGACTTVLQPLHALIEAHVLAAERLHGDDTTVPILAKGKTVTGAYLDLCPRRSSVWQSSAAGGDLLRLAGSAA